MITPLNEHLMNEHQFTRYVALRLHGIELYRLYRDSNNAWFYMATLRGGTHNDYQIDMSLDDTAIALSEVFAVDVERTDLCSVYQCCDEVGVLQYKTTMTRERCLKLGIGVRW